MPTPHASRFARILVGVSASLLASCGATASTSRFDGFWQSGKLVLAPAPTEAPAWAVQPGDGVALVMFRSEGSSHDTADNEELVVQVNPAELAAGKPVALDSPGRTARYQRGGRKLIYASTRITGSLIAQRDGDRVRGQVSLTASAPSVGSGEISRQFAFELDRK